MSDEKPFHNPFASLAPLRDSLPERPTARAATAPTASGAAGAQSGGKTYARAVVRMERSGRGGKEATVIEQLDLKPAERDVPGSRRSSPRSAAAAASKGTR